jgi:hypothetical protein
VDRGKPGSKMNVLSDANGLPLLVGVSSGNTHDSEGLKSMVEGHQTRHDPHNGRYFKPQRLHAEQSLRPSRPAQMAAMETHRSAHRTQRHRVQRTVGAAPLGHRTDHVVAVRLPPTQPPLRAKPPRLPGISRTRGSPVLLQATPPPRHIGHGPRRGHRPCTVTPPPARGPCPLWWCSWQWAAPSGRRLAKSARPARRWHPGGFAEEHAPIRWLDDVDQEVPSHLRLRRT